MIKFYLSKSNKPNKKLMVQYISPETNRIRTIHFGAKNYDDYLITNNDKKKNAYIARHQVREDFDNYYKPSFYSRWLLWNQKTLEKSIRDTNKRYPKIKIINNI